MLGVYSTIAIYHSYDYNAIVFAILHRSALHTKSSGKVAPGLVRFGQISAIFYR